MAQQGADGRQLNADQEGPANTRSYTGENTGDSGQQLRETGSST